MTWSKEVCRRLLVFYVILCGCLAIGQALEGYLMEYQNMPKHIAGPINMCLFLYVLIKTIGYLKFERIK
jgi:hypothetical protein